jgi:hypothetical protein
LKGFNKIFLPPIGPIGHWRARYRAMRPSACSSKILKILIAAALLPALAYPSPVTVRHTEGLIHGFLVLSAIDGTPLAQGDLVQQATNDRVTNHLVFHFKDGSLHDETAVYSQRGTFHLLTYHLIQKGPTFGHHTDLSFDTTSGNVTVHHTDHDGEEKVITDHLDLPPDLANGLTLTLLKNLRPSDTPTTVSMIAATPKPRLVKLAISAQGEDPFTTSGAKRMATHYVIKVEIGGLEGKIAPLLGKQPPDIQVWVLGGEAPAFVKMEGPLFYGGPLWRIELASPLWPNAKPSR